MTREISSRSSSLKQMTLLGGGSEMIRSMHETVSHQIMLALAL